MTLHVTHGLTATRSVSGTIFLPRLWKTWIHDISLVSALIAGNKYKISSFFSFFFFVGNFGERWNGINQNQLGCVYPG